DPALDCCAVIINTGTVLKNGVKPEYFDTATYHFMIDCQTVYFVSDADPSHPHAFPVNRGQCVWREKRNWAIRPK
ncbi:MAG: hypothetical protein ACRCYO_07320, partial [Bacteroidia bacterium]